MKTTNKRRPYAENMYLYLKRQGYGNKYEHPGIYSISINNKLVYVGKSMNMLKRIAQHYVGIQSRSEHKYQVMGQAHDKGMCIKFDVLYYAQAESNQILIEEIGEKEGEYIRRLRPPLNTQIPKEKDWRKFDWNKRATVIQLEDILQEEKK